MGRGGHIGTVTCVGVAARVALRGGGKTSMVVSGGDDGALFLWRCGPAGGGQEDADIGGDRTGETTEAKPSLLQQHHRQSGGRASVALKASQFYGHSGPVWAVRFDPDRERLISGGYDATIKLWQMQTGRTLATLRGHEGWVNCLELLEVGRFAASGGSEGVIKLWDLDGGRCIHTTGRPYGSERHAVLCFAMKQQEALLSGHSGLWYMMQWDLNTGQSVEAFRGHDDDVYALHSDGLSSIFASGSKDRTVRLWDIRITENSGCVGKLVGHSGAVLDLKLRGNRLVSASMDKTLRMWDVRMSERPLVVLEGHSEAVHCVDFRDQMVVSGSRDTSLKIWSMLA